VKSRKHFGATSLDLTIPAQFCARLGLHIGDAWTVSAHLEDGVPHIVYTRVQSAPQAAATPGPPTRAVPAANLGDTEALPERTASEDSIISDGTQPGGARVASPIAPRTDRSRTGPVGSKTLESNASPSPASGLPGPPPCAPVAHATSRRLRR
jgi:hypothetical protein